ncbi:macrophage mannose receptor 1-like, partial [Clarias magur]
TSSISHQYHFVNEYKNWTQAQRYCRVNYTDLATIDNMKEINSLLNAVNESYKGLAWIGLYDNLDDWRWSLDDDAFYNE